MVAVAFPRRPGAVRVDCVTARTDLDALRAEWDALWASTPRRTPFQHSAWLLAWSEQFAATDLRVLIVRDGCRLVGIAPFYVSRNERGERELRLLGAGISDYLDVLAAAGQAREVLDALREYLTLSAREWSVCALDHLRPQSLLLRVGAPYPFRDAVTPDEPCPVLVLPGPLDRSKPLAAGIHKWRRRSARYGDVAVEHATRDTVQPFLSTLFALHEARWARTGTAGVLADQRVQAFHRAAAPGLLAAGLLRLFVLRVGGRAAAAHYGLHAADRTYFYIGGFDPAFAAISPGKLAIAAAIEQALADGASTFDFLAGREAYKYEWGATDTPRLKRHLTRAGARRA